ncbi:MAG: hypothetical protein ABL900_00605 [Burkholderiaceae bacterium]
MRNGGPEKANPTSLVARGVGAAGVCGAQVGTIGGASPESVRSKTVSVLIKLCDASAHTFKQGDIDVPAFSSCAGTAPRWPAKTLGDSAAREGWLEPPCR